LHTSKKNKFNNIIFLIFFTLTVKIFSKHFYVKKKHQKAQGAVSEIELFYKLDEINFEASKSYTNNYKYFT
jgi:hypothetical protein